MLTDGKPRVAFVVQRCGVEVNGGAEQLCLQVAQRMAAHWQVEILSTCAHDYVTWANHYPEGEELVSGVKIRRFVVDGERDNEAFNDLSRDLAARQQQTTAFEQAEWMRAQGPMSSSLLTFLEKNIDEYVVFIFFGYLYAQSYFGLQRVARKAILAPFAHDEWPMYFSMWNEHFCKPRAFVFSTFEEKAFLQKRFPHAALNGEIVGVGIERPHNIDVGAFRNQYGITERFLLYVGRVDPSKGCDTMFEHYLRWQSETNSDVRLVVVGGAVMPIPEHPSITHLGFVDDATKWNALAACQALIMPSPHESLSMVLLEAWSVMRPVIVNGACDVLVGQCRRANGGLWFDNYDEFSAAANTLVSGAMAVQLGKQGHAFVEREYAWEHIEQKYCRLISANLEQKIE